MANYIFKKKKRSKLIYIFFGLIIIFSFIIFVQIKGRSSKDNPKINYSSEIKIPEQEALEILNNEKYKKTNIYSTNIRNEIKISLRTSLRILKEKGYKIYGAYENKDEDLIFMAKDDILPSVVLLVNYDTNIYKLFMYENK